MVAPALAEIQWAFHIESGIFEGKMPFKMKTHFILVAAAVEKT